MGTGRPILTDFCTSLTGITQAQGEPDLSSMLPRECARKGLQVPPALKRYCNVKRPFKELLGISPGSMVKMLRVLNLSLEGRHHSGIDDTRNISRVVAEIASRGAVLDVT